MGPKLELAPLLEKVAFGAPLVAYSTGLWSELNTKLTVLLLPTVGGPLTMVVLGAGGA